MIEPNFTSTDVGDYERNLEVKEEPFEEHYLPESVIETATDLRADEGCCLCPEGTRLQILLYEHIQKVHLDEVSALSESRLGLSCCLCSDGLSIQTELINHLLSHFVVKCEVDSIHIETNSSRSIEHDARFQRTREKFEEPKFTCNLCMKQFQYKQGLKRHMKNEHSLDSIQRVKYQRQDDRDGARVNCEFCPKVFKYKQGAQKHWDLEHNPINAFPCPKPECSSRCKTLKNLHAHLRTHEPPRPAEGLENLQCHKCLKVFPSQKQLSLHFYTHREKFFCCDICGSKFNNREQIKNHVMRHVGLFHKKVFHQRIICDQCSMMVYSHKMKRHKLIHHSDEKPFRCDFSGCDAAFSDTRILSDHKNIHLRLKPYKCEYCTEAFRSGANLRLHRIRHTDPERYRCIECQTSFVTKQALQKHNRRHTEDPEIRPFACDHPGCNSTFKQKDHVRNHIRRTHEKSDEVFFCEFCEKSYNRKDALGKHQRKAHNITKRKSRVFPIDA